MERLIVIAGIALVLAGCGLKGDLYLPPEPPPAAAPAGPTVSGDDAAATAGDDGDARRQVPPAPDRSQAR